MQNSSAAEACPGGAYLNAATGEVDELREFADTSPALPPNAGTNASVSRAAIAQAQAKMQASFMLFRWILGCLRDTIN